MTQPLDKTTLVRQAWVTELRRQGHRKCVGCYSQQDVFNHGSPIEVCAFGLLHEVAGVDTDIAIHEWGERGHLLAGLTEDESQIVVNLNDGTGCHRQHTFAEIADVVEGWFR